MPTGLAPSAENLLKRPYGGYSPFAPAGITDATRQGWATHLQGLGAQYGGAQNYARSMAGYANALPWALQGQMRQNASFNPWNPMLRGQIGAANQQLGRDYQQGILPGVNAAAIGSGVGGLSGARAGVAEGISQQGLADAMQRQTTDMSARGYEAGLGRQLEQVRMNNQLFQTGWGQMMPQAYRGAFQASQAPGGIMQGIGSFMGGIGGQQQAQNQRMMDWYNNQYNHAQQYPDQRFNQYTQWMAPIHTPGQQAPLQAPGQAPNPWAGAIGGGMAGFGAYDAWQRSRQGQGGQGGWGGVPDPYGGWGGGSQYPNRSMTPG